MQERKIVIRPEAPHDQSAVFRVNELAFGQPNEARLVDALRPAARPYLSLVAVDGDQVVGHILFTPITIESEGITPTALGLAPMLERAQDRLVGVLGKGEVDDAAVDAA
jgi:putative acetyltransferase